VKPGDAAFVIADASDLKQRGFCLASSALGV
jgi:hypothetical protein